MRSLKEKRFAAQLSTNASWSRKYLHPVVPLRVQSLVIVTCERRVDERIRSTLARVQTALYRFILTTNRK